MSPWSVTTVTEMKAAEQDCPETLFIMLYTMLLTFDPLEEALMIMTIHLNQAVLKCINSCSDRDEDIAD